MTELEQFRRTADAALADLRIAKRQAETERTAAADSETELAAIAEAKVAAQAVAESVQKTAHARIAGVATRCLEAVFPDRNLKLTIEFVRKRGRTEAEIRIVENGVAVRPALGSDGGAVDVASFALRLASIKLKRPKLAPFVCLDEPWRNVNGAAYQTNMGSLLVTLAKELGMQFAIVTDDDWIIDHFSNGVDGKVIRFPAKGSV